MIIRYAFHEIKFRTRNAADRSVPTVAHSAIEIARVEAFKTLVQRHPTLPAKEINKSDHSRLKLILILISAGSNAFSFDFVVFND